MKILFSHPGVGIFVQQAARALYEANYLDSYHTSFYYNPDSLIQSSLSHLSNKIKSNLSRRNIKEIPLDFVRGMPYYELLRILSSKLDNTGVITDRIHELSINKFDSWVSRNLRDDLDAVYCYEYNSLNTLRAAKNRGLFTIYEIPSPEHNFVHNLLKDEIEKFPELETEYFEYTSALLKERTEKRQKEYELADLIIVNSSFTKNSFDNIGLDTSKIKIIPLGCPPVCKINVKNTNDKLKIIWAGTFSIRKGAHYLLDAFINENKMDVQLDIYGKIEMPSGMMIKDKRINYKSSIPRSELLKKFNEYDVLLFPTLCDGFGMVITEALSYGLPVITTKRAGAADLIKDKINGLLISPNSSEEITDSINWCINNRNKLVEMGVNALDTAGKWQWKDYRELLLKKINQNLNN